MDATLTPAAQVIISIIPIVGIACGATVLFFALLWHHREIKQRIATGTYTPIKFNLRSFCLLTGLTLMGVGAVLSLMFILLEGLCWALLGGLIPLVLGIALWVYYKVNPDFKSKDHAA